MACRHILVRQRRDLLLLYLIVGEVLLVLLPVLAGRGRLVVHTLVSIIVPAGADGQQAARTMVVESAGQLCQVCDAVGVFVDVYPVWMGSRGESSRFWCCV